MIVFIGCTKKKKSYSCEAKEMYSSSHLFKKEYEYAKSLNPDSIYILSAKYGLLHPDSIIEPYEQTLKSAKDYEIKKWSIMVAKQIKKEKVSTNQKAVFLCGKNYYKYIKNLFSSYEAPLQHLGIGEQMKWLKEQI